GAERTGNGKSDSRMTRRGARTWNACLHDRRPEPDAWIVRTSTTEFFNRIGQKGTNVSKRRYMTRPSARVAAFQPAAFAPWLLLGARRASSAESCSGK